MRKTEGKKITIRLIIWGPHNIIWGPHLGSRPQLYYISISYELFWCMAIIYSYALPCCQFVISTHLTVVGKRYNYLHVFLGVKVPVRRPKGERRPHSKGRRRTVVSMYGYPVFDEVSVVIFRYRGPGDDSLDLHMTYVLAIYGASISSYHID